MTKAERIHAALNLEKPDRVPFTPFLGAYAGTYMGKSQGDYFRTPESQVMTILEMFDDCGGWDGILPDPLIANRLLNLLEVKWPVKFKYPGAELPDDYGWQVIEAENIKFEDYDQIIEEGFNSYYFGKFLPQLYGYTEEDLNGMRQKLGELFALADREWSKRDVSMTYSYGTVHPFFKLCLGRTMLRFTEDMYFHPEVVDKVMERMTDELIAETLSIVEGKNCTDITLVEERAGAYQFPLHIFERFWMPYTEKFVDAMWSRGIRVTFHIDTDWGKNLPYFKRLPKKSFCLELDSTTNIFEAKKIIGDHCCLMGDVPATMLSVGTPQDVEDYCTKLVKEVGYNGGFILSTGCECPIDCKKENFLKMREVAENSYKLI